MNIESTARMHGKYMQTHRTGAIALLAFLLLPLLSQAQGRGSDALLHEPVTRYQWVGAGIGYGYWDSEAQFGISENGLPCSFFTDGEGSGLIVEVKGIFYPLQNTWFMVSPRVHYESRASTFITQLAGEPVRIDDGSRVILDSEAQVDGEFGTMTFDLMVGLEIAETGFYFSGGGSAGLLLGGTFDYTERLLTDGFTFSANGDTEQQLISAREFDNYGTMVADIRGSLGYIYKLSDQFALNLEGTYSLPLLSAFNEPDLLKQQGIFGTLSVLYNIGD